MSRKSSSSENKDRGNIYVLINQSIPGQVKIGKTKKTPEQRAKQLSGTGVPTPYEVAYYREVMNMSAVEKEVHRRLQADRTNDKREFFAISVPDAISMINTVYESFLVESLNMSRQKTPTTRKNNLNNLSQKTQTKIHVKSQPITFINSLCILSCAIGNIVFWSIFASKYLQTHGLTLFNLFGLLIGIVVTIVFAVTAIYLRKKLIFFLFCSLFFSVAIQIVT